MSNPPEYNQLLIPSYVFGAPLLAWAAYYCWLHTPANTPWDYLIISYVFIVAFAMLSLMCCWFAFDAIRKRPRG